MKLWSKHQLTVKFLHHRAIHPNSYLPVQNVCMAVLATNEAASTAQFQGSHLLRQHILARWCAFTQARGMPPKQHAAQGKSCETRFANMVCIYTGTWYAKSQKTQFAEMVCIYTGMWHATEAACITREVLRTHFGKMVCNYGVNSTQARGMPPKQHAAQEKS
eukprot:1157454-Pelagomonas_calceolata.AAC.2